MLIPILNKKTPLAITVFDIYKVDLFNYLSNFNHYFLVKGFILPFNVYIKDKVDRLNPIIS